MAGTAMAVAQTSPVGLVGQMRTANVPVSKGHHRDIRTNRAGGTCPEHIRRTLYGDQIPSVVEMRFSRPNL
jgi:hypothetical protein